MRSRLATPHGRAKIVRETAQLVAIEAESELAAFYAQGYVVGCLRLWQLELTRRVAAGELAALFGASSVATDRFHRDLDLRGLAQRECARDADSEQARQTSAYVAGINQALAETRLLPIELLLVRHRPRAFTPLDIYLVAQLKYFINSAWQFELLHTLIANKLDARRAAQLFATPTTEGTTIDPLPRELDGALASDAASLLDAASRGLELLGLSSPDIGSNAFAISGPRTTSGFPLLAADPHMGNVNPGYNVLMKVVTDDGLAVIGSHFPGAPGIVVGRNRELGWGMVGLMADNQDLIVGTLSDDRVRVLDEWIPLERDESVIEVRNGKPAPHVSRGHAHGRLLRARGDRGLFLRWPALDAPLGSFTLSDIARATDWTTFRHGVWQMTNAPMLTVYADRHGHTGYQAVGLIPRRRRALGSIVQSYDDPAHRWDGYHAVDELPHAADPAEPWIAYANQYARAMFDGRAHVSNRWHPPSRAWRIAELLGERPEHDVASACAIQDDRVDRFARDQIAWLGSILGPTTLDRWRGDTTDVDSALLFERLCVALVEEVVRTALPRELADRYADMWPAHRWNVFAILRDHAEDWGLDPHTLVRRAFIRAGRARRSAPHPRIEFRHSLRRHPIGRLLFSAGYPYDGGSRETVHVARRNTDFLTSGQVSGGSGYHFGPAFKLVYDFSPGGGVHYLANTPASGLPFGRGLATALARWRTGRRYMTRFG